MPFIPYVAIGCENNNGTQAVAAINAGLAQIYAIIGSSGGGDATAANQVIGNTALANLYATNNKEVTQLIIEGDLDAVNAELILINASLNEGGNSVARWCDLINNGVTYVYGVLADIKGLLGTTTAGRTQTFLSGNAATGAAAITALNAALAAARAGKDVFETKWTIVVEEGDTTYSWGAEVWTN